MAEALDNPILPTLLIGATGTGPGSDAGTVDPATARILLNVANGATVNASDASLRDRATHTGAQGISTITGLQAALNAKVDSVNGRTGVVVPVAGDYNADQITETAAGKILTSAERTKLAGVAAGATVNSTDAALRDRASHTGSQTTSTITGLDATLATLAPKANPTLTGTVIVPTLSGADNSNQAASTAMVQSALATVSGGTHYLGNWNATTNTPTLTNGSGVGTPGGFYVVSVAGSTAIDGINSWTVGDWIISDNVGWKKIDQTDAVNSVFGRAGTITAAAGDYNADQITETATNKIMVAAERTKLAGIATGATANATDAALRDRTTHTGAQAISTVTGLQTALDSKVPSVFARTGAVVAVAGDYNADQVTETAGGKIMTAAERTKLAGIEVAATADQTAAEIETAYNAQVPVMTQAEAEAGTSTTVRRVTPERIKQAIAALAPGGSGGGGIGNTAVNQGSPGTALGTTELAIGTVTITPSNVAARILVIANCYLNKDVQATTVRVCTVRLRRGAAVTGVLVGAPMQTTSTTGATASFGPFPLAYIDVPGVTTAVTYSLTCQMSAVANSATATSFEICAAEVASGATFDINGLPADSTPDPAADYVATYDASAGVNKKVLLANLAAGSTFKTIAVTGGGSDVVADSSADTLTLVPTGGVTIATNAATDTITFGTTGLQSGDNTLTGLAGLPATLGLVEQTATDVFGIRALGVGATTSVPTRADADARYVTSVSPALTGTPTAPTATTGTNTTQLSTTAFVQQELGAAANFAFRTVSVAGQSDVVADSAGDILTMAAGANVTLTTTPGTDTITIAASGGGGGGLDIASLTEDTTPDAAVDFFPSYDTSSASNKKVRLDNIRATMANGATGAIQRTAKAKFSDTLSITDFGAVMDGTTDDTAALQKAIDYAELSVRAYGRAVIDIIGPTVLDYAALTPPTVPITLRVNGRIQVKSTFVVSRQLSIVGVGGYNNFAQFLIGPACVIEPHSSLGTDHTVQCMTYAYMEGVMVYGDRAGKAAIHVGLRSTDPAIDDGGGNMQRQCSLVVLIRVGAEAQGAAQAAMRIEHTFWFWLRDFHLGNVDGPCIHIADSYYPGVGANHSGLIDVRDGVMSGGGIEFGDASSGYGGGAGFHFWFTAIHQESGTLPFLKFSKYTYAHDLHFNRNNIADPAGMDTFVDNTYGTDVTGVYYEEINQMYGIRLWKGVKPRGTVKIDGFFPSINETTVLQHYEDMPLKKEMQFDGETEICNAFRGGDFAPQMVPANALLLMTSQDPTSGWTQEDGSFTITGGQTAPDGSATAYRIQSTGGTILYHDGFAITTLTNDWVLYGGWVRTPNQANNIVKTQAKPAFRLAMLGGTGGYWDDNTSDTSPTKEIGQHHSSMMTQNAGWMFISDMFAWNATTAPGAVRFHITMPASTGDLLIWRPICLRLPRSAFSKRDASRILSSLSLIDVSVKPGTLGQMSHQTFRTGAGATGSRPSASTVGQGAQWFDTTLNQPIWSNGTTWATATTAPAVVGSITGQIETVAIKTYTLDQKAAAAYTINSLTTKSGAGSCTATLRIDGTAVTGAGTSHTTTETETAATAANVVAVGQTLTLVVTANTTCTDLTFTVKTTS